jgi:hypothetical protein
VTGRWRGDRCGRSKTKENCPLILVPDLDCERGRFASQLNWERSYTYVYDHSEIRFASKMPSILSPSVAQRAYTGYGQLTYRQIQSDYDALVRCGLTIVTKPGHVVLCLTSLKKQFHERCVRSNHPLTAKCVFPESKDASLIPTDVALPPSSFACLLFVWNALAYKPLHRGFLSPFRPWKSVYLKGPPWLINPQI